MCDETELDTFSGDVVDVVREATTGGLGGRRSSTTPADPAGSAG